MTAIGLVRRCSVLLIAVFLSVAVFSSVTPLSRAMGLAPEITNTQSGSGWGYIGDLGTIPHASGLSNTYVTIDDEGVEYRAYQLSGNTITVQRLLDGEWATLGGENFLSGTDPELVVDNNGDLLLVAFVSVRPAIYKYNTGSDSWDQQGSSIATGMVGMSDLELVVDGSNNYHIAVVGSFAFSSTATETVQVYSFDSTNWVQIGAFDDGENELQLILDTNDALWLVYRTSSAMFIKQHQGGSTWSDIALGPIVASYKNLRLQPGLAGKIHLMAAENTSFTPLHHYTYSGGVWTENTDASFPTEAYRRGYDFFIEDGMQYISGHNSDSKPVVYSSADGVSWSIITNTEFEESRVRIYQIIVHNQTLRAVIGNKTGSLIGVIKNLGSVEVERYSSQANVVTVTSDSVNPVTYTITGGVDKDGFTLDANTGELAFAQLPGYLNPRDVNADNIYEVEVSVTDVADPTLTSSRWFHTTILPDPGIGTEAVAAPWDNLGATQPFYQHSNVAVEGSSFSIGEYQQNPVVAYATFEDTNTFTLFALRNGQFEVLPVTTNNSSATTQGWFYNEDFKEINGELFFIFEEDNLGGTKVALTRYDEANATIDSIDTSVLGNIASLKHLSGDTITIAYQEIPSLDHVVQEYDAANNTWQELSRITSASLQNLTIGRHYDVTSKDGVYYYLFRDSANSDKLSVISVNGGVVAQVGNAGFTEFEQNNFGELSIEITSENNLVVLQNLPTSGGRRAQVYTFENGVWNSLSEEGLRETDFGVFQLVIDQNDTIIVRSSEKIFRYIPTQGWQDIGSVDVSELSGFQGAQLDLTSDNELVLLVAGGDPEVCEEAPCELYARIRPTKELEYTIPEGVTGVGIIGDTSNSAAGFEHAILGGEDADKFALAADGSLEFVDSPDFENPVDSNTDNQYIITTGLFQPSLSQEMDSAQVIVTVSDIDEQADEDNDGVITQLELQAPNNGDGNNDGVQDFTQSDVASLPTLDGNYIVLDGNGCSLNSITVVAESELALQDEAYDYPNGLVDFTGNCAFIEIDVYIFDTTSNVLRKFQDAYTNVDSATVSNITIDSQEVIKASYQISDGDALDTSPAGDNIVRDPFGFAIPVAEGPVELIRTGGV